MFVFLQPWYQKLQNILNTFKKTCCLLEWLISRQKNILALLVKTPVIGKEKKGFFFKGGVKKVELQQEIMWVRKRQFDKDTRDYILEKTFQTHIREEMALALLVLLPKLTSQLKWDSLSTQIFFTKKSKRECAFIAQAHWREQWTCIRNKSYYVLIKHRNSSTDMRCRVVERYIFKLFNNKRQHLRPELTQWAKNITAFWISIN